MRKTTVKAPAVLGETMLNVAIEASRLANAAGLGGIVAVPAKRSVQWRVKFTSEQRAKNATKRKSDAGSLESFSVSKNVIFKRMAAAGVSYDTLMADAYEKAGAKYVPAFSGAVVPLLKTPKAKAVKTKTAKVKAVKPAKATKTPKTTKVEKPKAAKPIVGDAELEAMMAEMLGS